MDEPLSDNRLVVLDTETTGLEPSQGHRIIEIGCVEMIDRRVTANNFHQYIQPDREIDQGAAEVHGITNEFLMDKPRFADIASDLMAYIKGATLVIHNAPFDIGFLNHELSVLDGEYREITSYCSVVDTLVMAKKIHPGQRNSLDALCKRYEIDNSQRELHGALLDSEILAEVYLAMTGGQTALSLDAASDGNGTRDAAGIRRLDSERERLRVVQANAQELSLHQARMAAIDETSSAGCIWFTRGD